MLNLSILLQAAATGKQAGNGMTMIFILLIIVIFYFFMIRPQQKRQKQMEEFKKSLEKGDKITTIGGIHGKIVEVRDNTFMIEIANDVRIELDKAAVAVDEAQLKAKKDANR